MSVDLPVVPVGLFKILIIGDVEVVDLPGALVVRQISPFDQVVNVSVFIETARQIQMLHTERNRRTVFNNTPVAEMALM